MHLFTCAFGGCTIVILLLLLDCVVNFDTAGTLSPPCFSGGGADKLKPGNREVRTNSYVGI